VTNNNVPLPAGHTLTVSVVDGKAHVRQLEDFSIGALVTNDAPAVFGPYGLPRNFRVQDDGNASAVVAEADTLPSALQKAALDAIPTVDAEDGVTVWDDAGVLKVSTSV
jgi:hypothetical protein